MLKDFTVTGMSCAACSARVEQAVRAVSGVNSVTVNLLTGKMRADFSEPAIEEKIVAAVRKAGYDVLIKNESHPTNPHTEIQTMKKRLILSFAFLIPLMYVSMGSMLGLPLPAFLLGTENTANFAFTQLLLCLPVAYINRAYYQKGFRALINRSPNMDTLISTGSAVSLLYGVFSMFVINHAIAHNNLPLAEQYRHDLYFESAVMILALVNLGKYMEAKSKGRTGEAIRKLMDMKPDTAWLEKNGTVTEVPADQLQPDDIVHVKPFSRIPADGITLDDGATIDESSVTGESIPAEKEPGDRVNCATMNLQRAFRMRVTQAGENSSFAQMIRMVEDAGLAKAPVQRLADKISGIFVPTVMLIALITAVIWLLSGASFPFALSRAVSVLVISCPCALGLATPTAIMAGTGRGAEAGVLIRSGEALERAAKINCVVMDKTGTLTLGKPAVSRILSQTLTETELLRMAASLEAPSEHPLSRAVNARAKERNITPETVKQFESVPGRGVKGIVNDQTMYGGSIRWMKELQIDLTAYEHDLRKMTDRGETPLIFARTNTVLGVVAVSDDVKPTAAHAVQRLKELGLKTVMLTGDNERVARTVSEKLGISQTIAGVLPMDKAGEVEKLRAEGNVVAMVGDGVNDAAALKTADVGIAIGAGADVAVESADIVMMHSDPADVAAAIQLSRKTLKNIRENLFWAFFYNVLGIPIAAGVFYRAFGLILNPMIAAAAMSCSSLFVVTNALRLRKAKITDENGTAQETPTVKKEENEMTTIKVEGMMCPHCQARVKKALEAIEGVTADVDLEKNEARVTYPAGVSIETLKKAIVDAGYDVTGVE